MTVAANGMEVVAGILLEKGMGMKAGKFITLRRCAPVEEVDLFLCDCEIAVVAMDGG